MIIKPKVGIDSIKLGMTRVQVERLWGKPNTIDEDFISIYADPNIPKDKWIYWEYSRGVELCFHSTNDFLLSHIDIYSSDAIFENIKLIGLSERELWLKFNTSRHDDDYDTDDGWGPNVYEIDQYCLNLMVKYRKITNITLYPEHNATGDTPIWPNNRV
ncbi:MAG: hypothetical protein L3J59_16255 [Methylococcaceae bacterium]|nr:hypothetical protein [Methylococcaceae bacterium]